ncbi:MAG: hypothetical protein AAGA48_13305 [Myxococcota bacterium]
MRLVTSLGLIMGLACAGIRPPEPPMPDLTGRLTVHPRGSTDADNGYLAHQPPGYGDGRARPLLVFWHGIGENGNGRDELALVVENGPPRLINEGRWPDDRSFIVLSPQHSGRGCPTADEIQAFFTYAIEAYDVDPARVYLTGLSCGAIGGWSYLGEYGKSQIAAAVLVAGDGVKPVSRAGCELGDLPIWAFHGDADGVVPPSGSIQAMEALAKCPGAEHRRLTVYPGVEHDSWTMTYDGTAGHDIYSWLAQFTR